MSRFGDTSVSFAVLMLSESRCAEYIGTIEVIRG